jgi:hypothetical protein
MASNEVPQKPKRRVAAPLLITGISAITLVVVVASAWSLFGTTSMATYFDIPLVILATGSLDIIFYKLMRPASQDLDTERPRLHLYAAAVTFSITVWDGIYLGLSYLHPNSAVPSDAQATLAIAGLVVPAGATFILAVAALPRRVGEES